MQKRGSIPSQYYPQVSHANLTLYADIVKRLMMSVIYGPTLSDAFAKLNQDGSSEKMYQGCSQAMMEGFSVESCETWPWGGYFTGWVCLPAHAVGAPFWGERVAIVAASDSVRRNCMDKDKQIRLADFNLESDAWKASRSAYLPFHVEWSVGKPKRGIYRNDDGIPTELDRLKSHGNAVVPQQFYPFFKYIAEIEGNFY